jgi:hypothetical protein
MQETKSCGIKALESNADNISGIWVNIGQFFPCMPFDLILPKLRLHRMKYPGRLVLEATSRKGIVHKYNVVWTGFAVWFIFAQKRNDVVHPLGFNSGSDDIKFNVVPGKNWKTGVHRIPYEIGTFIFWVSCPLGANAHWQILTPLN